MKPEPAAYLVLLIDPRTSPPSIAGVDLYSCAHPAVLPLVGVVIMVGYGHSYEAGVYDIRLQLDQRPGGRDLHGWMVALMPERTRREVGRG